MFNSRLIELQNSGLRLVQNSAFHVSPAFHSLAFISNLWSVSHVLLFFKICQFWIAIFVFFGLSCDYLVILVHFVILIELHELPSFYFLVGKHLNLLLKNGEVSQLRIDYCIKIFVYFVELVPFTRQFISIYFSLM